MNWYTDDPILTRYAKRYLPPAVLSYLEETFQATGKLVAGPMDRRAVHTDREGQPRLIRYNKKGEEINEVWYNEGYLQTVRDGYGTGVVGLRYDENAPEKVPFLANGILFYLLTETECGFTCPVALTQSVAFVLEKFGTEEQKRTYLTRLASIDPDVMEQGGTFLTEIQGGSDVGATKTVAVAEGDHYLLTGEKWFASNCDAEISITLARVNEKKSTAGLGLFLLPRTLPDGTRNPGISIRRLKDKLGVRAVASGELVLNNAVGYLIGTLDHGFKYMAEALNVSRLDTALGGLAIARRAFLEAAVYTSQREAFGNVVARYPMVQETLANLITEIEAGWAMAAQMISKFDQVHTYNTGTQDDYLLMRILLSLGKTRLSDLGVTAARQSLELHGGNGYIEEYVTPRLLRDAIVNPVWEGTANIQALEVLKTLHRGGAAPFVADLQATLASLEHPALKKLHPQLSAEVARAQELISHVLQQDQRQQTALAKKLADFMYDVYTAVHLAEEAQYDLLNSGDGRRLLAAEQWVKLVFSKDADRGILSGEVLTDEQFEALVAFGTWSV
ncbi:hypothetical protein EL26_05085 [Tumebacillus flagellatus]|uniref:Isovaleryl-CoA dehydrogenase n=1 Tax=Tumebacillus flagellatus TaxID=1157490 RepID=A0A074LV13_9BACL|nr:hypothetical protein EL26_05085 [Tumebacillus flagellatus]